MGDYMQGNPDNSIVVPFSDDEKETKSPAAELLEEDKPTDSPEERITRRRKREDRIRGLIQSGEEARNKLKELEERDARRDRELAELRGALTATQQLARQNDNAGKDPFQQRLDAVYEKQDAAYNAAQAEIKAGTLTPERQKHWERVARELESEKMSVHTERAVAASSVNRRAEQQRAVWEQKYPEVYDPANKRAYDYAEAMFNARKALGEQPSNALVDEVMAETMTRFKLGARPAATASERSRMSGVPSAGSGGGSKPAGIVPTPLVRSLATAAYSDLPEDEAIRKWTSKTGKRLRDKKVL